MLDTEDKPAWIERSPGELDTFLREVAPHLPNYGWERVGPFNVLVGGIPHRFKYSHTPFRDAYKWYRIESEHYLSINTDKDRFRYLICWMSWDGFERVYGADLSAFWADVDAGGVGMPIDYQRRRDRDDNSKASWPLDLSKYGYEIVRKDH